MFSEQKQNNDWLQNNFQIILYLSLYHTVLTILNTIPCFQQQNNYYAVHKSANRTDMLTRC